MHPGPVTSNDEYNGEVYDARLETPGTHTTRTYLSSSHSSHPSTHSPKYPILPIISHSPSPTPPLPHAPPLSSGWTSPQFNDSAWAPVALSSSDKGFHLANAVLDAMAFPPIDVMHTFTSKWWTEPSPGVSDCRVQATCVKAMHACVVRCMCSISSKIFLDGSDWCSGSAPRARPSRFVTRSYCSTPLTDPSTAISVSALHTRMACVAGAHVTTARAKTSGICAARRPLTRTSAKETPRVRTGSPCSLSTASGAWGNGRAQRVQGWPWLSRCVFGNTCAHDSPLAPAGTWRCRV